MRNKAKKKVYLLWSSLILVLAVVLCLAVWPTNYFIESPGEVFPVSEFVKAKGKKSNNLNMVTISVSQDPVSVLHYLWSFTQAYNTRISSQELLGQQNSSQYEELQNWYMETSQQNAIYYAAKRAKVKHSLAYQGVYVLGIQKDSSFKNKLQTGDTILAVDHQQFKSLKEMMDYLNKKALGQKLVLTILRNKKKVKITGKAVKIQNTNRKGIGIQLVERIKVKTKPKLTINAGEIGGPSAGLMFALESYSAFTHQDLTNGHKIAGTGTIDAQGKVGIIGGIDKKVVSASKAGAEVFFAPTDQTEVKKNQTNYAVAKRVAKKIHTKMKIVPVARFEDALRYLQKNY